MSSPGSRSLSPVPPDAVSERIAAEIRSQESFHSSLLKDLAKVAASPSVDDGENFHSTFLRALNKSGLETRLQNAVFHLLRTKTPEQWAGEQSTSGYALNQGCSAKKREPLAYMIKIQVSCLNHKTNVDILIYEVLTNFILTIAPNFSILYYSLNGNVGF